MHSEERCKNHHNIDVSTVNEEVLSWIHENISKEEEDNLNRVLKEEPGRLLVGDTSLYVVV